MPGVSFRIGLLAFLGIGLLIGGLVEFFHSPSDLIAIAASVAGLALCVLAYRLLRRAQPLSH
jgi:uncharacterized membrane protein (UPF0136 family)